MSSDRSFLTVHELSYRTDIFTYQIPVGNGLLKSEIRSFTYAMLIFNSQVVFEPMKCLNCFYHPTERRIIGTRGLRSSCFLGNVRLVMSMAVLELTSKDLHDMQEQIDRLEKEIREILVRKIVEREFQLGLITDKQKANLENELADKTKYSLEALNHIFRVLQSSQQNRNHE